MKGSKHNDMSGGGGGAYRPNDPILIEMSMQEKQILRKRVRYARQ